MKRCLLILLLVFLYLSFSVNVSAIKIEQLNKPKIYPGKSGIQTIKITNDENSSIVVILYVKSSQPKDFECYFEDFSQIKKIFLRKNEYKNIKIIYKVFKNVSSKEINCNLNYLIPKSVEIEKILKEVKINCEKCEIEREKLKKWLNIYFFVDIFLIVLFTFILLTKWRYIVYRIKKSRKKS